MNGSFKIGSIFGIPILIHWTFLVIIPLFAWIIGSQIVLTVELLSGLFRVPIDMGYLTPGWNPYILGAFVALGLFGGVLVHEIAHCLVAKRMGVPINSITLLIFGGVSSMEESTPDPKVELPMALVGPLTSLGVGLLCTALLYVFAGIIADPPLAGLLVFIFAYLGLLNIFLFAFNLLPAFPMDGGRVLRAYLARKMPLHRATRIAANIGKMFAVIFGIFGVIFFSPILILIAFFIYIGAGQESTAIKYNFLLKDVNVGDIMERQVMTVPPTMPVREVIDLMYSTKHLGFPVVDRGFVVGMITLADVHKVPPLDREAMQARDIMTREVIALAPGSPVIEGLRLMSRYNIGRIPVMEHDHLVGIITRTDILKVIELKEI
ncbi:MAG: Zinc metalloprotease [Methanoregulaceae archaeon PtaB.Bin009]|jgi:Zn-dependent protease/CBS domain-containing protein|nr:MAG: Zinc metalloprotease [Methanoregulaceae archaeon PtaB.Bin009]OPY38034.1 MAG: Zinc metalloprotease [Methanoregulaceae archaeon PtaU1.Bin066]HNQ30176.1 CBS domain-containing protein [Methanolinea sp.]